MLVMLAIPALVVCVSVLLDRTVVVVLALIRVGIANIVVHVERHVQQDKSVRTAHALFVRHNKKRVEEVVVQSYICVVMSEVKKDVSILALISTTAEPVEMAVKKTHFVARGNVQIYYKISSIVVHVVWFVKKVKTVVEEAVSRTCQPMTCIVVCVAMHVEKAKAAVVVVV